MSITAHIILSIVLIFAAIALIAWGINSAANDYYEKERIKQLEHHISLWGGDTDNAAYKADVAEYEQLCHKHGIGR